MPLRYMQREAIDAVFQYWGDEPGNPLVDMATGTGKSITMATLTQELVDGWPDLRVFNVAHREELVEGNYKELIGVWPFAPAGIYSAGLGRKDAHAQVIFGGIQSIANKAHSIGDIDLVIVDEAHAISRNSDTLYGKFLADVRERNPEMRLVGTTATDYRMDSGRLTEGEDRLFDDVVYEIGIGELMEKGYLTRLSTKQTGVSIDLSRVGTRGGEFIPGQLEEAADRITTEIVTESLAWARRDGRKAALYFCSGQDNSDHVRDEIRRQGMTAESLTSRTTLADQARIVSDFCSGRLFALCSANMLTTGANYPFVDMIVIDRATKSPGLYVQICGRGTRNHPGKVDCLVLDYGGNRQRHGPIDKIQPKLPGSGSGEAPIKLCPRDRADVNGMFGCEEILPISIMTCTCCGYVFPPNEEEKISARADDTPLLSTESKWSTVGKRTFRFHPAKVDGNPPSVKITYMVGLKAVAEWCCPQHLEHPSEKSRQFPKTRSDKYWRTHGGQMPAPKSVQEWLERAGELLPTAEVQLSYGRNPKYPEVVAYKVGTPTNDNQPVAENDNDPAEFEDSIPY